MKKYLFLISLICIIVSVSCSTGRTTIGGSHTSNLSEEQRRKFDYFFLEANKQKQLGNQDMAFELYLKALAIYTASAQTKYELANYYLRLNRPVVALDYLESAYKSETTNHWYVMNLGGLY